MFIVFLTFLTTKSSDQFRVYPANIRLDEDVLKTSFVFVFRRRLDQDEHIGLTHTSSEDVLIKTNIFILVIRFQDVFKTSSRRLAKMSSRRFQDVSSSYTVLVNKFSRCLQDVFTTFLRRTAKTVIYTEGFPLVILVRNYGQCTKFVRVATVSKVLVFHFSTHFSGCLQRCIQNLAGHLQGSFLCQNT